MNLQQVQTGIIKMAEKYCEAGNEIIHLYTGSTNTMFEFPEIRFFHKGKHAGQAVWYRSTGKHALRFNDTLAMENWGDFENTVIHEVAHIVTHILFPHAKPHGPEFKRMMKWLGGVPNTYHTYDVSNSKKKMKKYHYVCDCTTHKFSARRHNSVQVKGKVYACRSCGTKLDYSKFTGKVTKG